MRQAGQKLHKIPFAGQGREVWKVNFMMHVYEAVFYKKRHKADAFHFVYL